jgi:hypothetical protein
MRALQNFEVMPDKCKVGGVVVKQKVLSIIQFSSCLY